MLRVLILFILCPALACGQIPEPMPGTYVNDHTGNLSNDQVLLINQQIRKLEDSTTVQLAILLINHLPANTTIEDYAREVGNTWKVGNAQNGMVYVGVLNERRHRLEIARNLEGDIPDAAAAEIIDNLVPYLRQQDYYGALLSLVDQTAKRLGVGIPDAQQYETVPAGLPSTGTYEITNTVSAERAAREEEKKKYDRYGTYAVWGIIGGLIIFCIWAWRFKKKYIKKNTVNGVYMGVGTAYFASTYGDHYSGSGSGGSSGFGGFGGGGGGGFSGGGASGSW
jgi:uncharacterized protein